MLDVGISRLADDHCNVRSGVLIKEALLASPKPCAGTKCRGYNLGACVIRTSGVVCPLTPAGGLFQLRCIPPRHGNLGPCLVGHTNDVGAREPGRDLGHVVEVD